MSRREVMVPCINPSQHHVTEHVPGSAAHRECVNMKPAKADDIPDSVYATIRNREPVDMTLSDGRPVSVTPGVIDEDAKLLFTRGQCLAFATEMSKKLGTNRVVAYSDERDETLIHAYAEGKDGTLYDIEGDHDPDDEYERWSHYSAGIPLGQEIDDGDYVPLRDDTIFVDPDVSYPVDPYENPDDEVMQFMTSTNYLPQQRFELAEPFAESMSDLT